MNKKLSLRQSVFLGVAGNAPAYGVGIATATIVASSAHAAPIAVLICGLAMIGILIAYQKLNEHAPNCGAAYSWVGKLIHPMAGFLAGWCLLVALEFFMVSALLAAGQAFVTLLGLSESFGKIPTSYVLGLAILLIVTVPSLLGAHIFGRFQFILTFVELLIVLAVAITAVIERGADIAATLPFVLGPDGFRDIHNLSKGIVIAVFFFWGWDVIFNLSEETFETRKNSAIAALYTVILLITIYFVFTIIALALLNDADLLKNEQNILLGIANKVFPPPYGNVALIAFLISLIGSLDASIIQFSRTLLAKSRDGVISRQFAQVSQQAGVPTFGIIVTVVLATIIASMSIFSATVNEIITAGVTGSAIFVAVYYALAGIACSKFFGLNRQEHGLRRFVYVIWPVIAAAILVICAVVASLDFGMLSACVIVGAFISGLAISIFRYGMVGYK